MEDVTKEYLRALNKIAEDPKPYPLYEEIIWADYMMALASNPKLVGQSDCVIMLNFWPDKIRSGRDF